MLESPALAGLLINLAAQSILIALIGILAIKALTGKSAPVRGLLGAGIMATLGLVFIISIGFQMSRVSWYESDLTGFWQKTIGNQRIASGEITVSPTDTIPFASQTEPQPSNGNSRNDSPAPAPAPQSDGLPIDAYLYINALGLIWMGGFLFNLAKLGNGLLLLHKFRSGLSRAPAGEFDDLVRTVAGRFWKNRLPELYISPKIESPVTVGLLRPVVIIPEKLYRNLSADELKSILLHELAHIYHCDHIVGVLKRIVLAIHWWNPLVYRINMEHDLAREEVSDNYVLSEFDPKTYSRCLADLAEKVCLISNLPTAAGMAGRRFGLEKRVKNILSKKRSLAMRTSLNLKIMAVAVCAVFALLIGGCYGQFDTKESDMTDGGTRLVLKVMTGGTVREALDRDAGSISRHLKANDIAIKTSSSEDGFQIQLTGVDTAGEAGVRDYLNTTFGQKYEIEGKTAEGKTDFTLSLKEPEIRTIRESTVSQTADTLRKRIDALGVDEADLQITIEKGKDFADRIVLELPGIDDPNSTKVLLKNSAQFRLYPVKSSEGGPFPSIEAASEAAGDSADDYRILEFLGNTAKDIPVQYLVVHKDPIMTGNDLKSARPMMDANGNPSVSFTLKSEPAKQFADFTGENTGERLAIVLEDKVYAAPVINARIQGEGMITGNFTFQEAKDLALLLNSGALPAPVQLLEESYLPSTVDPFTGTWILNLSKSKITPEVYTPKSQITHMVLKGSAIEVIVELVYESGEKENIQSKAKFDGKDYPITVEPGHPEASFTAAYERVDKNTIKATLKRDGHVLATETIVLSPDGRSLTGSYIVTGENGRQFSITAVFDKQ